MYKEFHDHVNDLPFRVEVAMDKLVLLASLYTRQSEYWPSHYWLGDLSTFFVSLLQEGQVGLFAQRDNGMMTAAAMVSTVYCPARWGCKPIQKRTSLTTPNRGRNIPLFIKSGWYQSKVSIVFHALASRRLQDSSMLSKRDPTPVSLGPVMQVASAQWDFCKPVAKESLHPSPQRPHLLQARQG